MIKPYQAADVALLLITLYLFTRSTQKAQRERKLLNMMLWRLG